MEVAGAVHRNSVGIVEPRRGGRAAIAVETGLSRSGDGGDVPALGVDLADAVAEGVRNVEVAGAVQRNPTGAVEPRRGGRAAVAAIQQRIRAGDRFDYGCCAALRRERRRNDCDGEPQREPPTDWRRQRQQAMDEG